MKARPPLSKVSDSWNRWFPSRSGGSFLALFSRPSWTHRSNEEAEEWDLLRNSRCNSCDHPRPETAFPKEPFSHSTAPLGGSSFGRKGSQKSTRDRKQRGSCNRIRVHPRRQIPGNQPRFPLDRPSQPRNSSANHHSTSRLFLCSTKLPESSLDAESANHKSPSGRLRFDTRSHRPDRQSLMSLGERFRASQRLFAKGGELSR